MVPRLLMPSVLLIGSRTPGIPGGTEMSRYERKSFFERLVTLRDAYAAEPHATVDLTVDTVVVFAEAMYNALAAAEAATGPTRTSGGSGPGNQNDGPFASLNVGSPGPPPRGFRLSPGRAVRQAPISVATHAA